MERFFLFLKKIHLLLIFILLEVVAISYYATTSVYTNAKTMTVAGNILRPVRTAINDFSGYFALKGQNEVLTQELLRFQRSNDSLRVENRSLSERLADTLPFPADAYSLLLTATVVNNTVSYPDNLITIDKGENDGVTENAALTVGGSVVGYIVAASPNFAVGMSVLNLDFKSSGQRKEDGTICSIYWDGKSSDELAFSELSKYAPLAVGDTITTTGFSTLFPSDYLVGVVSSFEMVDNLYYKGKIRLTADMSRLRHVTVIKRQNRDEQIGLEQKVWNQTKR